MPEMSPEDKKHVLYIAGAVASIAGLVWIFRRGQSNMPIVGASQSPSSGASNSAIEAAKINAATALAIEQSKEQLTMAQIQASQNIALAQIAGQIDVAQINASAKTSAAGISAASQLGKSFMDAASKFLGGDKSKSQGGHAGVLGQSGAEIGPIYGVLGQMGAEVGPDSYIGSPAGDYIDSSSYESEYNAELTGGDAFDIPQGYDANGEATGYAE